MPPLFPDVAEAHMKVKPKPSGRSSYSGLPVILSLNWSYNRVTCVEEHDFSFFFPTRIYHTGTAKNSQYDLSLHSLPMNARTQLVLDILCTSPLILCNLQENAADLRSSFKMSRLIMVPVLGSCSGQFWISGLYLHIHLKNNLSAISSFEGHNALFNTKQYNIQHNFKMVKILLNKWEIYGIKLLFGWSCSCNAVRLVRLVFFTSLMQMLWVHKSLYH